MKIRSLLFMSIIVLFFSCKKDSDSDEKTIVANSAAWDGRYRVEGTLVDVMEPTYAWPGDSLYTLEVVTPTQLKLVSKDLGFEGHLVRIGMNLSYYGTFGLLVNIDSLTHKVTSITNFHGQPSLNNRSAILDPSGVNEWDPSTKNVKIKYWMYENDVLRTSFDETWVYIGAR